MPKKKTLTQQDSFVRNLFSGMTQRGAYLDAYPESNKLALATVDMKASRLTNSDKVQAALAELRQKAEDAAIATVIERKKVLSEILRARLSDFIADDGELSRERLRSAALAELKTAITVEPLPNGDSVRIIRNYGVKLLDPVKAITELNKMEGIYSDGPTVNVDNRQVVIRVVYADAREGTLGVDSNPALPLARPTG